MAKNFHVGTATFDGVTISDVQNHRIATRGEVVNNSAGVDDFVSSQRVVGRKVFIQVSFNDHDDIRALQGKLGTEATLTLTAVDDAAVSKVATVLTAILIEAVADAQHADYGQHVVTWEARAADGATDPLSWA
jgi:hypothetical protein